MKLDTRLAAHAERGEAEIVHRPTERTLYGGAASGRSP